MPVAWSPDGKWLASGCGTGYSQTVGTGSPGRRGSGRNNHLLKPWAQRPGLESGQSVHRLGGNGGTVRLWDVVTRQRVRTLSMHIGRGDVTALAWSPGRQAAGRGRVDRRSGTSDLGAGTWQVALVLGAHAGEVQSPTLAWSPDGSAWPGRPSIGRSRSGTPTAGEPGGPAAPPWRMTWRGSWRRVPISGSGTRPRR